MTSSVSISESFAGARIGSMRPFRSPSKAITWKMAELIRPDLHPMQYSSSLISRQLNRVESEREREQRFF